MLYIKDNTLVLGTEMDAMSAVSGNRADLVASWKLVAGDVNFRAMHLFRYKEVSSCTICGPIFLILGGGASVTEDEESGAWQRAIVRFCMDTKRWSQDSALKLHL